MYSDRWIERPKHMLFMSGIAN